MRNKKVRFVQLAILREPSKKPGAPRSRLIGVDTCGRAWERFSDMPPGEWGLIEAPDEPERQRKERSTKRD